MNLLNVIPVIGWLLAAILSFFIAIPIYFLWNWLAPIYFTFLPELYLALPFWHVVGLIWLLSSVKGIMLPSFSSTTTSTKKD